MIIGLAVIVVGVIWLFSANGLLDSHTCDLIWSLVVIGLGVWLIGRSQREQPWWQVFDNQNREDWERWGKEFGGRMERWGRSIGQETSEHSKRISQDIGRQIEGSLRNLFNSKPDEPSAHQNADQSSVNNIQHDR
jgi:hypothetical protein